MLLHLLVTPVYAGYRTFKLHDADGGEEGSDMTGQLGPEQGCFHGAS